MQSHKVESRQLGAWLFAGLSAPVAQFAGGMAWQTVVLTAAVCLGVCWLVSRREFVPGKWLCFIEYIWLVCVAGGVFRWVSDSWSSGDVYPAVPLIILALGAAAAYNGPAKAARAGSTLFWLLALIYSGVVAAGIGEVDVKELSQALSKPEGALIVAMLIPALTAFLPHSGKLPVRAVGGVFAFAVTLSVLITGTLSAQVAMSADSPLHVWVEGLSLAGTLQRFEAVVSVALTMGWFALLSFLLCAAGELMEGAKDGAYDQGVWGMAVAVGSFAFAYEWIRGEILAFGCVLLWIIAPKVVELSKRKRLKKFENNA